MLLLHGCASDQKLRSTLDPALPARIELENVPFFAQSKLHCGPAALATVLSQASFNVEPEQLAPKVFTPSRGGSLPLDMLGGARRTGAVAVELDGSLNSVLSEVASGRPVTVLQNLGLSWYPVWHYAVLVGYDLQRNEVILRSGTTRRETLTLTTFNHTWARSGKWAMIVLRPGEMSERIEATKYAPAIVALERIGDLEAAKRGYDAGITRWPMDLVLRIGAGNMAYKSGDLSRAEEHYRAAVAAHPTSDAALNNLAQVLADRSQLDEAIEFAARAVAINGPQASTAKNTLRELREKRAAGQ